MSGYAQLRSPFYTAILLSASLCSGCHSHHIDATIENRTGAPIQLIEVDYPSASFGADSLADGAEFHYQFQVRGSGPLKLAYTSPNGQTVQISGPILVESQQGWLDIVLKPGGKAQFHAQLAAPA